MEIIKNEEIKAFLDAYSYFGESALSKDEMNNKRGATVRAHTEVECLSIGRTSFFNIFGNEVENIVIRNSVRKMFRESIVFKHFSLVQMEKCINKLERKIYQKESIILKANVPYKTVFFIVDKFVWKGRDTGEPKYQMIVNDLGFYNGIPMRYPDDVVAVSADCKVLEIQYEALYEILGSKDLERVFCNNSMIEEMFFKKRHVQKAKDYSSVAYVRTLGVGGQGVVALIEDEFKRQSALKVIPKDSVKTKFGMRMVKVEHTIMIEREGST